MNNIDTWTIFGYPLLPIRKDNIAKEASKALSKLIIQAEEQLENKYECSTTKIKN